jgi:dipeptidyl aminopeptidase/acylaminoacyl peptidase
MSPFRQVALLLLLVILTGCSESTEVQTDEENSLWQLQPNPVLVFVSKSDSPEGELYLLEKDNSITRLTHNERLENNPALSPDSTKVAFHAGDPSDMLSWEIVVLDLVTGEEIQITDNRVLDGHPDWSPDGSRLVYGSFSDAAGNPAGAADIVVVSLDGTVFTRLTDSPWEDNDPEWSPDGMKIAFKSTRLTQEHAREEIFVMNADGSQVQRLTTSAGWQSDHDPSWSPDGTKIAFSRFEGERRWTDIANVDILIEHWSELMPWNVYTVDLSGKIEAITDSAGAAGLPVFADDGVGILYLYFEFITDGDRITGADHLLFLFDVLGEDVQTLIPLSDHAPTLEYYDW